MDFLDGDLYFRQYHKIVDIFIDDEQRTLNALTESPRRLQGAYALPTTYNFKAFGRAPVVKISYFLFGKENTVNFFDGPVVADNFESRKAEGARKELLKQWHLFSSNITTPFILLHSSNENWVRLLNNFIRLSLVLF